ncbi:digeranylgeranylglycerophospholipid reductase [Halococcus thailandensis]|uniref:FAD dependent oxidoreductase n=1 Tax=Halococcus thailandensis JCM 13552 TaxID=1227457 RepID=M0N2L5_9EURY|nr:digeranylgeranylglycerophospholipid reductase [Halococcus thailandensis]EMA52096.1 FAD dependent oxidoreductase [Halococcus thailandensis JCM 13552]
MSERYDVVIAGAGPAGAQCARDLAERGYEVLVLETEPEGTFPAQSNKSTGGTFPSMMGSFGIPDDVVMHYTDSVVLESPDENFQLTQPGAVLEFADFKRYLVRDGREHGATYRFDSRVSQPIVENGEIAGVRYDGGEEVYADIVIDATGPAAPLAKALGVSDLERKRQAIGIEWEYEGVALDYPGYADLNDSMMLRLDHDFAPGGYAWIFHTGADTAKVGLCFIQNEKYSPTDDRVRIDDALARWLDDDPRFAEATRIDDSQHRGSAHIQPPKQLSTDRFMAIGDTVPSVDPLWGQGIDKCMRSGRAAAVTADRCFTGQMDTSADEMTIYDMLWHRNVAPKAAMRLLMTHLIYYAPTERYNRFIRDLRRLSGDTLSSANAGNPLALAKLFHVGDIPLLRDFVAEHRELIGQLLPGPRSLLSD